MTEQNPTSHGDSPASLSDSDTLLQEPAGATLAPGARLSFLEPLGEGGMGVVWKARDNHLGRLVAVKRPKPAVVAGMRGRLRFLREAQACARLTHPNIVTLYHVGEDAEGPFIEMEYVEGTSLQEEVRRAGPLEERRVVELGCRLCDALALAHSFGIIHRDIKPANILLTARGAPKLGDFGLAVAAGPAPGGAAATQAGTVLGTLFYASPEQLRDTRQVDGRGDIYSLAATLYYALTGEAPRMLRLEKLPTVLRPVLARALAENPDGRYPDVQAFERALRDSQADAQETVCPHCGGASPLWARHCTQCGAGLESLYRACPRCGGENRTDQRYCQACGANLRALDEVGQIRRALERSAQAHLYDEMARLAERGLGQAPGDTAFTEAARMARAAGERLRVLRQRLAQAAPEDFEARSKALTEILVLTPGDAAAHEELEALAAAQRGREAIPDAEAVERDQTMPAMPEPRASGLGADERLDNLAGRLASGAARLLRRWGWVAAMGFYLLLINQRFNYVGTIDSDLVIAVLGAVFAMQFAAFVWMRKKWRGGGKGLSSHLLLGLLVLLTAGAADLFLESKEWEYIRKQDTVDYYRFYLERGPSWYAFHPFRTKTAEARDRLQAKLEQEAWGETRRKDSVEGYQAYLANYPQGAHAAEARQQIEARKDQADDRFMIKDDNILPTEPALPRLGIGKSQ